MTPDAIQDATPSHEGRGDQEASAEGAVDPVAAAAVTLAREAALEVGGADVGDHLGASSEDAHVVTHSFAATLAGYRGWHWAVTLARTPDSELVTVDEVVLLPGDDALRAPDWVPWAERVRPGDLGAGDLLPADPDDVRLVPSYFSDGDPSVDGADADDDDRAQLRAVADDLGLGRVRVLSLDGRLDAASRWFDTDFGPDAPMARQAPAHCGTCGFYVSMRGSLAAAFGVCANEYSTADAHVVAVEFGCGAHSEAGADLGPRNEPSGQVYDSGELVVEPTEAAGPTEIVEPIETAGPTDAAGPTDGVEPIETAGPTDAVEHIDAVEPIETAGPTDAVEPTDTAEPTQLIEPAETTAVMAADESTGDDIAPDEGSPTD